MSLNEVYVEELIVEYKSKFHITMMFGIPISELSADALRACICALGEMEKQNRKDRQREMDMMRLFRRKHGQY